MQEQLTLRTNLGPTPAVKALCEGRVSSPLVKLDFCGPEVSHNGFKPMVRDQAFDAGELAIVTFLQARAYGKPWVMLPVPLIGNQQHQCIAYNSERGVLSPKDIEGKRVGVRMYAQTTGMWVRGILQHEYGVDLGRVDWMTQEDAHLSEYQDPANCHRLPAGTKIAQMLLAGELDAAVLSRKDWPTDPRVRHLIPEPDAASRAWYTREGVIPINHLFVIDEDLARERKDVVREIHRMLLESRALAGSAVAHLPPVGVEANRKGIEMAIRWTYEQGIIPRMLSMEELYGEVLSAIE